MRTLILISFFACLFLHFRNKDGELQHSDILSTKQSAIKKIVPQQVRLPTSAAIEIASSGTPVSGFVASSDDALITDADIQDYDEDDLSQLPWDDIEEGWKTNLKEFLVSVDPEKAEDMLNAYLEEKKKYVERVDFTDETPVEEGAAVAATDPLAESDAKEGELERMHAENLKEIFGDHYSQVQSLHQEYVDSVQYLNRSSVKFSISL
jgi:hypothetical protein